VYVRVNTIGDTGDRPFVLVPGIGVSSTYFERLAPNLNEFGPVHALDLPGFGGVPHPGSALSIRAYADLLGEVIDQLGLTDPILVGHSMGTQIVADLASRRPGLTTVVLIGPVVNPRERRVTTQAVRFLQSSWHEPFIVKVLAIGAYLLCGTKWFSRILPEMMRFPIEERLPDVRAHTLVIRGEFDAVAPRAWVEEVGELLSSSRLWEIPGAAHSVMHAHAEEVARLCVEHARRTVAAGDDDTLREYPAGGGDGAGGDGGGAAQGASEGYADAAADATEQGTPRVGAALAAVAGRIIETVGVLTDRDDLIERGKSQHAEATAAVRDDPAAERQPDEAR
jgi:pimeloyl-ACP methyl ester carboxylesterase/uncharacterized protein YjbJ (UPF0337 family)